jgi:hypothetical protein
MGIVVWILMGAVVAVICAALAGTLANKKGHSQSAWTLAGFFFGPLGLLAAVGLPDRPSENRQGDAPDQWKKLS